VRIKTDRDLRKRSGHKGPKTFSTKSYPPLGNVEPPGNDEVARPSKQPLKLQSMVNVYGQLALLNVCINADTFLGRSAPILKGNSHYSPGDDDFVMVPDLAASECNKNTLNITLQYGAELDDNNKILKVPGPDAVIQIKRRGIYESNPKKREKWLSKMQSLITHIIHEFFESKNDAAETDKLFGGDRCPNEAEMDILPAMRVADFGVVAHEVGTMRMKRTEDSKGVVDGHLRLEGIDNLYICDLSIFPVSPPANPTLTLAALALRLGEELGNK